MKRSSGVLLPVFSLPSKYGCGTLGTEAKNFIDWLKDANQSYWQMLPINHTGFGDSPYCCYSSFAGNPIFVDLDLLKADGLITDEEINSLDWGAELSKIDYSVLIPNRKKLLSLAYERFVSLGKEINEFNSFKDAESRWLNPYASFMSEKEGNSEEYYKFVQYEFYKQWGKIKTYANEHGIKLIGDIPVYVPLDSADVNAEPEFFLLDKDGRPTLVAGVPPDYFNSEGQLWNNPLYNWQRLKEDGYGWWIRRIDGTLRLFDLVRIDHFRGFDSFWAVPYGEKNAINGSWMQGPGMDFVGVISGWFGGEHFIAEDLGTITDSVRAMLDASGFPGMKVLEFAFTEDMTSSYLPHNFNENCICYVGTHDNAPALGWADDDKDGDVKRACEYCGCDRNDINWGLIRCGMTSKANLFICQMQDLLGLGNEARTNTPGIVGGNWQWRLLPSQLDEELACKLSRITCLSGRK